VTFVCEAFESSPKKQHKIISSLTMRVLSLMYALVLLYCTAKGDSNHSLRRTFHEKTEASLCHRSLAENPVTYGQLYSHLSNIYGRLACYGSLSVSGSAMIVERRLFCKNDEMNVTLLGHVEGKDLYPTSLEECSGINQVPLCTELHFNQQGTTIANCTAHYREEACDCSICNVEERVGKAITCSNTDTSFPMDSGECVPDATLNDADRTGTYVTNKGFEDIAEIVSRFFSEPPCHVATASVNATTVFHSETTYTCKTTSDPFITNVTLVGSAQHIGNFPPLLGTRYFDTCENDDSCSKLFFDESGTLIDACSVFPDWATACEMCQVCTTFNGGTGINVECPQRPELSTGGACKPYPILSGSGATQALNGFWAVRIAIVNFFLLMIYK